MEQTKNNVLDMLDETEYVCDCEGFEIYIDMESGEYYAVKPIEDGLYLEASDHSLENLMKEIRQCKTN